MRQTMNRALLASATSMLALGLASQAAAADDSAARLSSIERQIQSLQAELHRMKHDLAIRNQELRVSEERSLRQQAAQRTTQPPAAITQPFPTIPPGYALVQAAPGAAPNTVEIVNANPPSGLPSGSFKLGGVTVTLGGFIEAAGVYRTRNEVADIASNFNTGMPLAQNPQYHQNEFRFSARQSRLSLEAKAQPDPVTKLDAYFEFDFLGAAPTANSVESNSYNLRIRHLYTQYIRDDLGLDILGGQTWTLMTMDKVGVGNDQPNYNIPLTIDAQYVPGFTWARQPQFRVAKSFADNQLWLAFSVENPQTNYYVGGNGAVPSDIGKVNDNNPGGSNFASTVNYSDEVAPDLQAKIALDEKFAHLEAYGVARFMHDHLIESVGTDSSKTEVGGGGGAAALIHVVPNLIDLQGSFLIGSGIGRYGAAQLPDATVGSNGQPVPLSEVMGLAGIVAHPDPSVDLYSYFGTEQEKRKYFDIGSKGYGYGSPLYSNTDCEIEGTDGDCTANTSGVWQATIGTWWKFLHSKEYGSMQVGAQYSYTRRTVFQGIGPTPKTDDNMLLFSFRYYPFSDTAPKAPSLY
jgi:hypothetical protein